MKHFLKIIFMIALLVTLDQWTKTFFFTQPDSYFIHKHFNHYFIFGSFKSAPPAAKYLFTGISFSTLLILFFTLDYIYFTKHRTIQFGLWMLISGITGNIVDKIFYEGVRDFIHLVPNVYTNLADLIQWAGFLLFTYGIFKHTEEIWNSSNNRRRLLVYPKEQIVFSSLLTLLVSLSCIAIVFTSLFFLKFLEINNDKKEVYLILSLGLTVFASISSFIFCIILSSKIWGPIYSFKRHLKTNPQNQFQSRKTDFLQTLGKS